MASTTRSRAKAPEDSSDTTSGKTPPVHEVRYRNIAVAIWKNTVKSPAADNGDVFYSVTIKRGWQDEQKQWHDSTSFPFTDLPTLAKAIMDAHSWIAWTTRREKEERAEK